MSIVRGDEVLAGKLVASHQVGWLTHSSFLFSWNRAITFLNHTVPDFTDNGASNFIRYGNEYFATSETNYIRKIDPVTLETQDKVFVF